MLPTYAETLDYLYTRLPMFSRQGAAAIKPDLTNTLALCSALGNPQKGFKSVHIAGTNGKGSTSNMLAAIFQEAGYKTGLYTSPHLVDFRERIRLDGKMVSEDFVVDFVARHRALIERIEPSFFEITVAMAFVAFAKAGVDMAIIETGLGGRLDSTNIITPELSIITNISFDHKDLLGDTIPKIAAEKAGIIKPGIPVVIGEYHLESFPVFEATAARRNAELIPAFHQWKILNGETAGTYTARKQDGTSSFQIHCDLAGSFQRRNIATVLTAVDALRVAEWRLDEHIVAKAFQHVKSLTGLRGRWDVWQESPLIIADVAHNPAGLLAVMEDWARVRANTKHIILGFVRDKDVREALVLFPKDAPLHFCAADIPRALPVEELAAIAGEMGLSGSSHPSVAAAVRSVTAILEPGDALLITGSFFIVGEAIEIGLTSLRL